VREAEEYPLLESVARKRLVKTEKCKCVLLICIVWRLAIAL
jgi:hypothetical protein